jgi:hypothetical protein
VLKLADLKKKVQKSVNSCIQGVLLSTFFISGPAGNSNGLKRRMIGV